jgi:hypothetical protein
MTRVLAILLSAAILPILYVPATAATQIANSETSAFCGPDGAEGYKRPGGYCEQIDDNNSLMPGKEGDGCANVADAGFRFDEATGRLLVAEPIDPCCNYAELTLDQFPLDAILVAVSCK